MKEYYEYRRDQFFESVDEYRIVWFKKGIYISLLLYFLVMLPQWQLFFGADAFTHSYPVSDSWEDIISNLLNTWNGEYALWFLLGVIILLVMAILIHLLGVVMTEIKERNGLVSAMFTGKKVFENNPIDLD